MLRAQAFVLRSPQSQRLIGLPLRKLGSHTHNDHNSYTRGSAATTALAAVNSRELRFHNGSPTIVQQKKAQKKKQQPVENMVGSLPEVLVASMSNYFFAGTSKLLSTAAVNNINNGAALFAGVTNGQRREDNKELQEKQLLSPPSWQAVAATQTIIGASSSRTITSTTTATATATTTLVEPPTVGNGVLRAPRSLLSSQQTFRASSTLCSNDEDDNPQKAGKGSSPNKRKNDQASKSNNDSSSGPFVNNPDNVSTNGVTLDSLNDVASSLDSLDALSTDDSVSSQQYPPPRQGYGYSIQLTDEEKELFALLRQVHRETGMTTTLRVAGGWVRDKLLATPEFQIFHHYKYAGKRLTSKFKSSGATPSSTTSSSAAVGPKLVTTKTTRGAGASMGRQGTKVILLDDEQQGPVDIDIALDTMLGREFADHLNDYLQNHGQETISVGVVLKNPERSKHLETATLRVGSFWIDFVNLRAEEYTQDSRIPDLMRIGTASEDAFRRDLTINSLFFNINTGQVEDWTGRGFADLRRGVVTTPLAPLTTLLDDPLRVLRSIRFAARLRFSMDDELVAAAKDDRVRLALAQKVSRERVGGEVDLMLRSPDPVGAMRLLVNLNLVDTVFPVASCLPATFQAGKAAPEKQSAALKPLFDQCLDLLSTTHDHLFDCKVSPPIWCQSKRLLTTHNVAETTLTKDEEARRLLWYAAFLKPIHDHATRLRQQQPQVQTGKRAGKKANRSIMSKLLVDELKRPGRDAEAVEKIMKAANDITQLIQSGCDLSATLILLSDVRVMEDHNGQLVTTMRGRPIDTVVEEDPVWEHAMEFRLLCSQVLKKVGGLWRAALMLSLSEQLTSLNVGELDYAIEGDVIDESKEERRQGIIEQYDTFAAALQQLGLIGVWGSTPLVDGEEMKQVLPHIPRGPAFRDVMEEQDRWIITHPGTAKEPLVRHLRQVFEDYTKSDDDQFDMKKKQKSSKQQMPQEKSPKKEKKSKEADAPEEVKSKDEKGDSKA